MTPVETFVFFDIETTGLPWQERNQTKIIEASFIAVQRRDIQRTAFGELPPSSKLTFVLNPGRKIHHEVTSMTKLDNKFLRNAPFFNQKFRSIHSFLKDLSKPVCLIAHNGNNFDYKILLAECNDAGVSLPKDILCADSLVGFRSLLKDTNIDYNSLKPKVSYTADKSESDLGSNDEDWPSLDVSAEDLDEIDDLCSSLSEISCEDIETDDESETEMEKKKTNVIKNVFEKGTQRNSGKVSFNLSALFKRLLNKEEVNAHRAEADCMMMIECVVALQDKFLPWVDGACKLLTEVKPIR